MSPGVYVKLAYHPVMSSITDLYELVLDISLKFKLSKKKKSYQSMLMCFETFLLRGNEQLTLRQCLYFPFHHPPPPYSPTVYFSLHLILVASAGLFFWSSSKCMFSLSMKVAVPRYLMLSAPQQVLFAAARL